MKRGVKRMPRKTAPPKSEEQKQLEKIGRAAKKRIETYLHDGHTLQASDVELINLYSETYQFYCQLKGELVGKQLLMEYTNKAGATNLIKNPLAIELTKAVQVLNNLLRSLGLTPAQRKEFADKGFIPVESSEKHEPTKDEFESF
jgi:P27 family predicted phage terminase small subunit